MNRLAQYYHDAKGNWWFHAFAVFCRFSLALGFIIAGFVKISGERFAAGLPVNNPMGHYLEALFHTQYYYTFIGISQVVVAILLLIPRTAVLGAIMYFPVILNICVLTYAVRFEGTRATTFMLLASTFLVCWYYDRTKYILPFKLDHAAPLPVYQKPLSKKFPFAFFGLVVGAMVLTVVVNHFMYDIRPGNSQEECVNGCPGNMNPEACMTFCDCIYNQAKPYGQCLEEYDQAKNKRR